MDFGDLKGRIIRMLGDTYSAGAVDPETGLYVPVHGNIYSADVLYDAVCAALDAISIRIWKQIKVSYSGGVGITTALLPSDFMAVEGIYDQHYQTFIPRQDIRADRSLFDTWGNAWFEYPSGTLQFMNDITSGVDLYYAGHFTDPCLPTLESYYDYDDEGLNIDDFVMDYPDIANTAIIFYCASYCLNQKAVLSANIRQFNTKVDSGQPGDNTEQKMADHFLRRFEYELQRIPPMPHTFVTHLA
jgi:hypothetical protein